MDENIQVEAARRCFAEVTGELEDAATIATEGQGVINLDAARQTSDRLIGVVENCLERLRKLRSALE